MAELKKILVSLPDSLLREVDEIVAMGKKNRSEFIREAMKLYIRERRKNRDTGEDEKRLRRRWQGLMRELTEIGTESDNQALEKYEAILSECE